MSQPNTNPSTYEGWVSIFETGTDYEADIVRDRLDDSGIEAVVLTQRDHAFNLNVGDLSAVHVMVKPHRVDEAREVIATTYTDAELEDAAMNADPNAPPAHSPEEEALLDSGGEVHRLLGSDLDDDDEDDDDRD